MRRAPVLPRAALTAALLVACGTGSRPARAEVNETLAPASRLDALLSRVVAPAPEELVRELLALPEVAEAEPALRVVGALWHAGGPHAAAALRELARHDDVGVREAALRGVAVLGLRGAPGSKPEANLRKQLDDADVRVRRAAYEALARVGGPEDVAGLIERLSSPEGEVRSLALRTLRAITGERLTPDAGRWAYWWDRSRATLETQVEAAIEALEAGVEELEAAAAWSVLERRAWVVPARAEEAAKRWLGGWEPEQRRDGYRLAAALRLLSLAKPVASAARRDAKGPAAEACLLAQSALGLLPPSR